MKINISSNNATKMSNKKTTTHKFLQKLIEDPRTSKMIVECKKETHNQPNRRSLSVRLEMRLGVPRSNLFTIKDNRSLYHHQEAKVMKQRTRIFYKQKQLRLVGSLLQSQW